MPEELMGRILPEGVGPRPEVERAALREMRQAFRERTAAAVVALFAAAMALVCLPEAAATMIEVMRKGGVWLATVFCGVSLGAAAVFLRRCERLRALGLPRARGLRAYWAWQLAGAMISTAVMATAYAWMGWTLRQAVTGMLPGILAAVWLGRRLNQIPDADDARADELRAMSLKQDEDDRLGG